MGASGTGSYEVTPPRPFACRRRHPPSRPILPRTANFASASGGSHPASSAAYILILTVSEMAGHEQCCGWVGRGVASPRPPQGPPHGSPGAEPTTHAPVSVEGCPRVAVWSGLLTVDGTPHEPQRARSTLGASSGRRTSRSIEKPGEVARASSWPTPLHHSGASMVWPFNPPPRTS